MEKRGRKGERDTKRETYTQKQMDRETHTYTGIGRQTEKERQTQKDTRHCIWKNT